MAKQPQIRYRNERRRRELAAAGRPTLTRKEKREHKVQLLRTRCPRCLAPLLVLDSLDPDEVIRRHTCAS